MADPDFFDNQGPITLEAILKATGAKAQGEAPFTELADVAALKTATPSDLSFFDNIKYKDDLLVTKAGAVFVAPETAAHVPAETCALISDKPYKAYALAAQLFYPEQRPKPMIHDSVAIYPDTKIDHDCRIDENVIIKKGAVIGSGVWIEAGTVIGENVQIGDGCRIGPHCSISHAHIGTHSRLYPGVRVGQDGFGFAMDPVGGHVKIPQLGRVMIGSHVEIGANTCIDRGAGPDTEIGDGTWIDNLVQIGHNAKIGKGCVLVAQCGISGSTVLEDYAIVAAQAGIAGHLNIGKGAIVGAQAGVMRDVTPGENVLGSPAQPIKSFMRQVAALKKLVK